jgi:hypothetical protein
MRPIPQSSRYLTGCFYLDATQLFDSQFEGSQNTVNTSTVPSVSAGSRSQWLVLLRPQAVMEVSPRIHCRKVVIMIYIRSDMDFTEVKPGILMPGNCNSPKRPYRFP